MYAKRQGLRSWFTLLAAFMAVLGAAGKGAAQAINPEVHRQAFEKAKNDAEVVAEVRVLAVVCTAATKDGDKVRSVALQVALQVLAAEKGPVKKNDIVVVSRNVNLPFGPGPGMYGYMGEVRKFPFTSGVKGNVALRWDKEGRGYVALAGWVAQPNNAEIPREVGRAIAAKD